MSNISKENDGVKYLLFVTDIFSRYLWIEPLKNKTGKEVVSGLKKIFSKGRKCRTFRVDRGKEFSNSHVMNYLKDEDVYFFKFNFRSVDMESTDTSAQGRQENSSSNSPNNDTRTKSTTVCHKQGIQLMATI